jgi:hypothetical protein
LELEWAAQYRALCRAPQGKLPKSGRLSKSKAQVRGSFLEEGDASPDAREDGVRNTTELTDGKAHVDGSAVGAGDIEDRTDDEMGEMELELEEEEDDDEAELDLDVEDDNDNGNDQS